MSSLPFFIGHHTKIHLILVHKQRIEYACLCEPYLILSSPRVVKIWCWRVFVTFSEDDLLLLDVWKLSSMKMVWSGDDILLSMDGWVSMAWDLNHPADKHCALCLLGMHYSSCCWSWCLLEGRCLSLWSLSCWCHCDLFESVPLSRIISVVYQTVDHLWIDFYYWEW